MIYLPNPATGLNQALTPTVNELQCRLPFLKNVYGRLMVEAITVDAAMARPDTTPRQTILSPDGDGGYKANRPKQLPLYPDGIGGYNRVVPDEQAGAMSFFIATGPVTYPEWDQPGISHQYVENWPLALIIWGRLDDIENDIDWLRQTALSALAKQLEWKTTSLTDMLQTSVFKGLDYDYINHRYLMNPFFGLRIEGAFTYVNYLCL